MKNLTRRELLCEIFSKDVLKTAFSAYHEFTAAQNEVKRFASCDEAACSIGKTNQEHSKNFFNKVTKGGIERL